MPIRWIRIPATLMLTALFVLPASAADDETLSEIVNVLREEGLIDEDEHAELSAKAAKKDAKEEWLDRFDIWGDFRARYEWFDYDRDQYSRDAETADPDDRLQNRHRARYRARLNLSAKVASRATVFFRLASGPSGARSTNRTIGNGDDFDTDPLNLDLAYATLTPFPDGELPGVEAGYLGVDLGKVKDPFIQKKSFGWDAMIFDNDLTLEGGNLRIKGDAGPVALFANSGIYVIDEEATGKDPKLFGAQAGGTIKLAEHVKAGARGSFYHFFSLDNAFYTRAAAGGNLIDGIGRADGSIQVAETSAFVEIGVWELFPVRVFGSYANNLTSRRSTLFPGEGHQDDSWVAGVFVGDKKQLVQLGFAYLHTEANSLPSMFIDSDFLDGTTNREGYMLVVARQLFEGVDLKFTGYETKRIEGGIAHVASGTGADRLRGQADMIFKF